MADFYADRRKFQLYQHPNEKWAYSLDRINKAHAEKEGLKIIEVPRMGDWRLFLCEPGIISAELVSKHAPDHGLLYLEGRRARVIKPAIRRADVAKDAEIRYLRFAIINGKNPYEGMSANQAQLTLGGEREAEQGKP